MYSKPINVIGVMSGTSLDGLDLCLVSFDSDNYSKFKILNSETFNYSSNWINKLSNAINLDEKDLNILDHEFGKLISNYINKFIAEIGSPKVNLVSSHGHTVFHKPEKGITKQIGNGEIIFKNINSSLICDFRTQDVELGGQGAPLVPIGDLNLFKEFKYCLNLGGFSNISIKKIIDFTSVIVTVSLSSHRKNDFENFETYIKNTDTITECIATGGGTDYIMKVITPNLKSFQELMNELISNDLKINKYMTYIVTKEINILFGSFIYPPFFSTILNKKKEFARD